MIYLAFVTDFGTGAIGDVTISEGLLDSVNSYARVIKIAGGIIEIDLEGATIGKWGRFHAGEELMIHVSATNGTDASLLGAFFIAKIELVDLQTLTLDRELPDINLDYYYVQAITIPHFDCLTLKSGATLSPPPYNPFSFTGGVLAFKCYDKLTFAGGNIDLTDSGIPVSRAGQMRPVKYEESAARGELDSGELAGQENSDEMTLNAGDGAVFISARRIIGDEGSRIGNPKTYGKAGCRGARDTIYKPSNITNIGGSTIFIAAEQFIKFSPKMLAKYRDSDKALGKGLARCYIATESNLPADGKLYARDLISDKQRVHKLGVFDFGSGEYGDMTNPNTRLSNFAVLKAIRGHSADYERKNISGLAAFKIGALCLLKGKYFAVARVLADDNSTLTLDFPIPADAEIIWTIPQFNNFNFNQQYHHYNFYIACSGICDLRGARINGDAFILAKRLKVDEATRIYQPAVIIADRIEGWNEHFISEGSIIYCN